jgi:hypothetical protein
MVVGGAPRCALEALSFNRQNATEYPDSAILVIGYSGWLWLWLWPLWGVACGP